MGKRPKEMSLDRIDNSGDYCKSNCKYSTRKEQQNNTRYNHLLTYQGKTQTMIQWSEELDIKYEIFSNRLRRGWSVEKLLTIK